MVSKRHLPCRLLDEDEVNQGFTILCDAYEWLHARDIRQWVAPIPKETYEEWQEQQANYGLFLNDQLAVVFSLVWEPLQGWPGVADRDAVLWLHALATSQQHRQSGVGRQAVRCALHSASVCTDALYLIFARGTGFLSAYYESLGFKQLKRDTKSYGEYGSYDMVLMRNMSSNKGL
jgi:ribosomal protein S18 acetylase RimI-like enzyme